MSAAEVNKWIRTIQLNWSNQMAYKLNFALVVLGPSIVFFFIKYNLWYSLYTLGNHQSIRGYTLAEMLTYQAWVLVVGFFAQGHNGRDIGEDIRLGRISSYLIYPFDFWKFHTGSFIAFQGVSLLIAGFTIALLIGSGLIHFPSAQALFCGLTLCCAVGIFWFQVQFMLALTAFWLEETWVLRVIFMIVAQFLSGAVIPLELFPDSLSRILNYTPFPYLTYVPVKMLLGEQLNRFPDALLSMAIWSLVVFIASRLIWRSGMRLYTAAGM